MRTQLLYGGYGPQQTGLSRRDLLRQSAVGFGSLALAGMMGERALSAASNASSLTERQSHFRPRAKRIIFLFMHGGPSQVDTFDYKPQLEKDDNKPVPFNKPRVVSGATGNLLKSPFQFKQHGQSGFYVSELFPHLSKLVDELCFINSVHGSNSRHGAALLELHTGSDTFIRPSMGSWLSYGLGSENQNLPGYITICPSLTHGGANNWGAAFLPAIYQGTPVGNAGTASSNAQIPFIQGNTSTGLQRLELDLLTRINRKRLAELGPDLELESRIESFELAFRLQAEAPVIQDISNESQDTLRMYGLDSEPTKDFGRQCLMARRFAEKGVRFIQLSHSYKWDQHGDLRKGHTNNAREVDQPIWALLTDLKQRGLLEDTLVWWGGEFGRTPVSQGKRNGRDHNPHACTMFLAGGGVKAGFKYGETDEYGYYAVKDKVHFHDLHATLLHLMGLDHKRLTYRYAGRDFRLTDIYGEIVHDLIA
ncbi:MAG: sulfatase [Planctomycetaceae bacterium]|nr:sulfatase [Planctomycetaceae bacterium]